MKVKLIAMVAVFFTAVGCTHSSDNGFRFVPDQYTSDVEYNSIYQYGYNQGCNAALEKIGKKTDVMIVKDTILDASNTRFNEGWNDGIRACASGTMKTIYEVK
jgi:hypothetical protein